MIVDVRIARFLHTRVFFGATFSLEAVGNSRLNAALARLAAEFLRQDMVDCLHKIMKGCANTCTVQSCVCVCISLSKHRRAAGSVPPLQLPHLHPFKCLDNS